MRDQTAAPIQYKYRRGTIIDNRLLFLPENRARPSWTKARTELHWLI
jgi:hypothetical protein